MIQKEQALIDKTRGWVEYNREEIATYEGEIAEAKVTMSSLEQEEEALAAEIVQTRESLATRKRDLDSVNADVRRQRKVLSGKQSERAKLISDLENHREKIELARAQYDRLQEQSGVDDGNVVLGDLETDLDGIAMPRMQKSTNAEPTADTPGQRVEDEQQWDARDSLPHAIEEPSEAVHVPELTPAVMEDDQFEHPFGGESESPRVRESESPREPFQPEPAPAAFEPAPAVSEFVETERFPRAVAEPTTSGWDDVAAIPFGDGDDPFNSEQSSLSAQEEAEASSISVGGEPAGFSARAEDVDDFQHTAQAAGSFGSDSSDHADIFGDSTAQSSDPFGGAEDDPFGGGGGAGGASGTLSVPDAAAAPPLSADADGLADPFAAFEPPSDPFAPTATTLLVGGTAEADPFASGGADPFGSPGAEDPFAAGGVGDQCLDLKALEGMCI